MPPVQINSTSLQITLAIAGLGLFLMAIRLMSTSLKTMTSGYTVNLLKKFSSSPWLGMLFGFIFTSIIQSSGGAVALAIGLLGAGMMNMKGALAFLLGANIGTSTTSLIVWVSSATDFTNYFMLATFIGVMILMLVKEERATNVGMLIASFGMLFVGLKVLGWGMDALGDSEGFRSMFKAVAINPWSGLFASIGLTGIMQSSSASITIIQHLYEADTLSTLSDSALLPSAIAMIFGANIGTTFIAFIISIGGNRDARRVAVAWMLTNSIWALLFMFLIYPWDGYGQLVQHMTDQPVGQLAMAHLLFNVSLSCTFIFFVKHLEWVVYKVVPRQDRKLPYKTELSPELLNNSPEIAFLQARNVSKELAKMTRDSMNILYGYVKTKDKKEYKRFKELIELIDITRSNLYTYLVELGARDLKKSTANRHMSIILASRSLERIPVLGKEVARELNKNLRDGHFNILDGTYTELKALIEMNRSITERLPNLFTRFSKVKAEEVKALAAETDRLKESFSENFVKRTKKVGHNIDFLLLAKLLQRMAHHGERVVKYISKGRKEVKFVALPEKLRKEIAKDLK